MLDERVLLLLGMLKSQSQHGYQINEFIERNLSRVIDMKRSTAYTLLDRLCEQGYVNRSMEQAGNRPQKKVYTITSAGEQKFKELLQAILKDIQGVSFPFEVALMFMDSLPPADLLVCLHDRLKLLDEQISFQEHIPSHGASVKGVDLAVAHRLVLLRAERDWIQSIMTDVLSTVETPTEGTCEARSKR